MRGKSIGKNEAEEAINAVEIIEKLVLEKINPMF